MGSITSPPPFTGFSAKIATPQSLTTSTHTKVAAATEIFDSDNKYDNSLYRFTPDAGKYCLMIELQAHTFDDNQWLNVKLYKNGSSVSECKTVSQAAADTISATNAFIVEANGTDYFEFYVIHTTGLTETLSICTISAFKIGNS